MFTTEAQRHLHDSVVTHEHENGPGIGAIFVPNLYDSWSPMIMKIVFVRSL